MKARRPFCCSAKDVIILEDEQMSLLDLDELIELEKWDRVRHILSTSKYHFMRKQQPVDPLRRKRAPSELSILCSKSSTPLDIIELSARKDPSKICVPDEYPFGNTPLHQVCSDSNIERLKVLLKYLQHDPDQVLVHNDAQQTPLHYAVRCYASLPVLQELVRFNPHILAQKHDAYGFDVFFLLWDTDTLAYQKLMVGEEVDLTKESLQKVLYLASEYWRCLGEESNDFDYAVHGLIHYNAFVEIILLALKNQPHSAKLLDRQGNTPLSLLLQYSSLEQLPVHTKGSSPCDVIQRFIEIYPESASIPNKMGELPLHHAIRANRSRACIFTVMEAFSEALECKDPRTGLYPFQLAAFLDRKIDDIYQILLAEPSIVNKIKHQLICKTK